MVGESGESDGIPCCSTRTNGFTGGRAGAEATPGRAVLATSPSSHE